MRDNEMSKLEDVLKEYGNISCKEFYEIECEECREYSNKDLYDDNYHWDIYYKSLNDPFYNRPQIETGKERKTRIKEERTKERKRLREIKKQEEKIRIKKVQAATLRSLNYLSKELKELDKFFTRWDILDI